MVNSFINKNTKYPIYKDKYFTPICKGAPFKGNTINIIQKNDVKGKQHAELQIINTYYSGCVRQVYNNKDNKTYTTYNIFPNHTKLYTKKMEDIKHHLYLEIPNSKITIECAPYHLVLKTDVEHKGMYFEGNIDNISRLKELNEILKDFKKILKVNTIADIVSTIKGSREIIDNGGQTLSVPHLDFKKYFKLKRDK